MQYLTSWKALKVVWLEWRSGRVCVETARSGKCSDAVGTKCHATIKKDVMGIFILMLFSYCLNPFYSPEQGSMPATGTALCVCLGCLPPNVWNNRPFSRKFDRGPPEVGATAAQRDTRSWNVWWVLDARNTEFCMAADYKRYYKACVKYCLHFSCCRAEIGTFDSTGLHWEMAPFIIAFCWM